MATINPIRWAMSQAGRPVQSHRPGADADEVELAYNRDPNMVKTGTGGVSEPWRNALTFQQSTWLNTSLKAFTKNGVSYGWSGIIGFIYPAEDFRVYLQAIGELSASEINSSTIVWNLFEVFNQQIVGIANVYCYFNRRSQAQLTAAGSSALGGVSAKFGADERTRVSEDSAENLMDLASTEAGSVFFRPEDDEIDPVDEQSRKRRDQRHAHQG